MPIVLFRRRLASAIDFDVPADSIIWSPCVLLPSVCRYGWHLNPKVAGWYRLTSLLTCDSPQCVDSNVISGIRWLMAGRGTEPSFILIFVYGALAAGPTLPLRLGWEMDRRYCFTPIWRRFCHISVARITVKFHPSDRNSHWPHPLMNYHEHTSAAAGPAKLLDVRINDHQSGPPHRDYWDYYHRQHRINRLNFITITLSYPVNPLQPS